jgi:copper homeostasis protein
MKHLLEICAADIQSVHAAKAAGADRVELCCALSEGGLTPSAGQIKAAIEINGPLVNVLIRPRFGDFLYSREELEEMAEEIRRFRELGANGVVIGALTPEGELDRSAMARLMEQAGGMEVTLHRAFDMTRDPLEALETAVELGCGTILTSGQAQSAAEGCQVLGKIFSQAAGRIDIMAGCGVKQGNIPVIHRETGIRVFHTTGRRGPVDSGMRYRKAGVSMGLPSLSEYELWRTDEEEFRACGRLVHALPG